jgi:uroporphyrinogen-III synthase
VAISQHFEGIAFFSPSAVQSYLSLNRIEADTCLFAIGRTTAAALSGPGNRVITSSSPDPDALLDAIIEFYQSGAVPNNTRNA